MRSIGDSVNGSLLFGTIDEAIGLEFDDRIGSRRQLSEFVTAVGIGLSFLDQVAGFVEQLDGYAFNALKVWIAGR